MPAISSISNGARPIRPNTGCKPRCTSHRPPTHNIWASCQSMAPAFSGRLASDVTDFDNLVLDNATRRFDDDHITLFLADQGSSQGGTDRNLAEFEVSLILTHDVVSD